MLLFVLYVVLRFFIRVLLLRAHACVVELLSCHNGMTNSLICNNVGYVGASVGAGGRPSVDGPNSFLAMSDAFGQSLPTETEIFNTGYQKIDGGGGTSMNNNHAAAVSSPIATTFPAQTPEQCLVVSTQQQTQSQQYTPNVVAGDCTHINNAHDSLRSWGNSGIKSVAHQFDSEKSPSANVPQQSEQQQKDRDWVSPLSATALIGFGVPALEVARLVDLQTYLLRNVRNNFT